MKPSPHAVVRTVFALLIAAFAAPLAAVAADHDALSLVVSYSAEPGDRVELLDALANQAAGRFAKWQHDGVIARWQLLYNRYRGAGGWDAMALLTFARPADVARWSAIERLYPGGLAPREAAFATTIDTVPVDLARSRREPKEGDTPVYLAIPYKLMVSPEEYLAYADGYVLPQFDGWVGEGVLAGYRIYVSRYPAGRPWSSLILLEYRSDAALTERGAVVAKVRARLKNDPKWKAISDNKKTIREELEVAVAQELRPRAAAQ